MYPHLPFLSKVRDSCHFWPPWAADRGTVDQIAAQPTGQKLGGTLASEGSRQGLSTFENPSSLESLKGRQSLLKAVVGLFAKRMASKRGYINPAPARPPSPMTLLGQAGRGRSRVYHRPVLFLFPVSASRLPLLSSELSVRPQRPLPAATLIDAPIQFRLKIM